MNINLNEKPWSCLKVRTIKEQLIAKKQEYETRLTAVEIMYNAPRDIKGNILTSKSKNQLRNRFNYLMHKLKAINRRIILLEGEQK